jgi:hypothetical protein
MERTEFVISIDDEAFVNEGVNAADGYVWGGRGDKYGCTC